jgi:hypothetical protein
MTCVAWKTISVPLALVALGACGSTGPAEGDDGWQQTFDVPRSELGPTGRNPYWVLEPGYQLVLANGNYELVISVLDETRLVDGVQTRVVEERETRNGVPVEVSRNFLAISSRTKDVYYFGEEVDDYEDGVLVAHEGAWLSGRDGAHFGLLMPGAPRVGQKHYQEVAPGEAMDRAEVRSLAGTLETPAGTFADVLVVEETTPLEPGERESKYYAPGIGLLKDGKLLLTRHGHAKN